MEYNLWILPKKLQVKRLQICVGGYLAGVKYGQLSQIVEFSQKNEVCFPSLY